VFKLADKCVSDIPRTKMGLWPTNACSLFGMLSLQYRFSDSIKDGIQHGSYDQAEHCGERQTKHQSGRHGAKERIFQKWDHAQNSCEYDHANGTNLASSPINNRLIWCLPFVNLNEDLAQDDNLHFDKLTTKTQHTQKCHKCKWHPGE
jgi:hypothetical protein